MRTTSPSGPRRRPETLDLEEEELDRVGDPGDLEPAPGERAVLDCGAVVVRHELALRVVAAERRAAAALLGRGLGGPGADEVGRHGIDRHVVARTMRARAVISGS
jgi:hypothetical protein